MHCQAQAANERDIGNPADQGIYEVLKQFLPCLKPHFFSTAGDDLVPCNHFHDPCKNAFPEGYYGFQLSIALHLRSAKKGKSHRNHYQAIKRIEWSTLSLLSAPSIATAVRSQDAERDMREDLPGQPPCGMLMLSVVPENLLSAKRRFMRMGLLQHYAPSVVVQANLIAPEATAFFLVQSAIAWHAWAMQSP